MRQRTILFIAALLTTMAHAQQYVLTELPTQSQLPVANIHAIMQDREGYMWYATQDGGLCRDNGYHIDVFRSDKFHPGLIASNNITDVVEDYDQHIIFGSRSGLYMLDKRDYSIRLVDEDTKGHSVSPVLMASDSTLWTISSHFIHHYDKHLQRMNTYDSLWKGQEKAICRMAEDSKGVVWISQWGGGIATYDRNRDQIKAQYWQDGLQPMNLVDDTTNGCYWVATWGNGIVKYQPDIQKIEPQSCTTDKGEYAAQVIHMVKTGNRLFASTMYGLKAYDIVDGRLQDADLGNILPKGMGITDYMTFDQKGNLWVAGFSPHTFILSPYKTDIVRQDFSDIDQFVNHRLIVWRSIDEGDYVWFGQERLILCLYDKKTGRITTAKDAGIKNYADMNMVPFIKCRTQKGIWSFVGSDVYHIWNEGMTIRSRQVATADFSVSCLYDAGDGNLYIGYREGVDVLNVQTGELRHLTNRTRRVLYILKSDKGDLYLCSGNHTLVRRYPTGDERVISDLGDFTSIALDKHGILWAADRQGDLLRYDPATDKAEVDVKGSNSRGDMIKKIAIDQLGHLWLLSDQEIKEYNPQNGNFRILSATDSRIQMEYFYDVTATGETMRVDGAGAILNIRPLADLDVEFSSARPMMTSLSIDGQRQLVGLGMSSINIEADAVNIELQFSTLNYLNADKVAYAYRVEGIDHAWHFLPRGINRASFVKLPKGKYTLELMATDENGCWGEPVKALVLNRLPAWYETWWAYLLYTLLLMGIVGLLVWQYVTRQNRRHQTEMEEQLTEMKFRFFTNISHELRTPLTLIITPLQSLRRRIGEVSNETISTQLALIDNNAQRLLTLVNRLLDFRKMDMGQQKLELAGGDFYEFVNTACEAFRPLSREKSIGLGCAIPNKSLYMMFDKAKVQHIIANLLSNAFKFTPEGGNIAVSVSETEDRKVRLTVKDTGCGIDEKDLPHIFERFFQSRSGQSSSSAGTGIGLNMVQEMTRLHGGTTSVESKVDEGTTFTVTLPTDLRPENNEPVDAIVKSVETKEASTDNEQMSANVLVVDDNDEFRQFLAGELSADYNILQAANGEKALQMVQDYDIDLIVSDVMMPQMDGMELCRRIKEDVSTSHIMVILLTARTAEEVKIEGFRSGADDYLSKPFNMEMLQLRISHLLELRQKCTEKFARGEDVKVEEVASNELDQKFLADAMAAVEKNLDNDAYDIDAFASDVCMSRSTVYRKLMSLTGQKPSEFIRTIRLKHAARLIKEGLYSLTDIGYMCGFSSASYFYRCFKKQYGVNPGNYE